MSHEHSSPPVPVGPEALSAFDGLVAAFLDPATFASNLPALRDWCEEYLSPLPELANARGVTSAHGRRDNRGHYRSLFVQLVGIPRRVGQGAARYDLAFCRDEHGVSYTLDTTMSVS